MATGCVKTAPATSQVAAFRACSEWCRERRPQAGNPSLRSLLPGRPSSRSTRRMCTGVDIVPTRMASFGSDSACASRGHSRSLRGAGWCVPRADHGGHRGGDSDCAPDGHTRSLRGENVVFIVPQIVKVIEDAIPICASKRTFANELWCRQSISPCHRS